MLEFKSVILLCQLAPHTGDERNVSQDLTHTLLATESLNKQCYKTVVEPSYLHTIDFIMSEDLASRCR